jgi:hypothetical protein
LVVACLAVHLALLVLLLLLKLLLALLLNLPLVWLVLKPLLVRPWQIPAFYRLCNKYPLLLAGSLVRIQC